MDITTTEAGLSQKNIKMDITISEAGPSQKNVKIVIPAEEIQKVYKEKIDEIRNSNIFKGFRSGHVPFSLVEKKFGKGILDEIKYAFLWQGYQELTNKHKLQFLREPKLEVEKLEVQKDRACTFEFKVEIFPEFTLPEWKGLEVKRTVTQVSDEEIEKTLTIFRRIQGEWSVVKDGISQEGDQIIGTLSLKAGEKTVLQRENMNFEAGTTTLAGIHLDKNYLIGRKPGDVCSQTVTIPATWKVDKEFLEKEALLTITILEVKRINLPPMDDAFAQQHECKDLAELKNKLRQDMQAHKEEEATAAMEDKLLEQLVKQIQIVAPEEWVKDRCEAVNKEIRENMQKRGEQEDKIKEYLEKHAQENKEEVLTHLKEYLLIERIAQQENIEVKEDEIEDHIKHMAQHENKWPTEIRSEYEKEGRLEELRYRVKMSKVLSLLHAQAKIVD